MLELLSIACALCFIGNAHRAGRALGRRLHSRRAVPVMRYPSTGVWWTPCANDDDATIWRTVGMRETIEAEARRA